LPSWRFSISYQRCYFVFSTYPSNNASKGFPWAKRFHSNCIIWSRKKILCIQTQTCNSKVILFLFLLPGSTTNYQDIKSLQSRICLARRLFEEDIIKRYIKIADEQSSSFTIMLPIPALLQTHPFISILQQGHKNIHLTSDTLFPFEFSAPPPITFFHSLWYCTEQQQVTNNLIF